MASKTAHGTLTATVVTTVTLSPLNSIVRSFRVQRRDPTSALTAGLFYSWGMSATGLAVPTVTGGDGVYCIPASASLDQWIDRLVGGTLVVKLISSDALGYSVETW